MASCPRLHPQRSFCSRAVLPCSSDVVAGGPFFFAVTKISIGCGRPLPLWTLQAEPFFFAATKIRIGRGPRCRHDCSRRNRSSSWQRKLESAADLVAATTVAGGPFSFAATKIRIGCGARCRYDCSRRAILYRHEDCAASIRKSGLEIKNRCTQEG